MTSLVVRGPGSVTGLASVPGDKSISHRALMLGAVSDGVSVVHNIGPGDDVASTIRCLEEVGVEITRSNGTAMIFGRGMRSWTEPSGALDCGNSGTTMRLLAGFAAHHTFASVLDGDASLRGRPMDRLVSPLEALGAHVETSDGHAPVRIRGGRLAGASVETGIASAQVKSCAIFAAIAADGESSVVEPGLSRDHTERLLAGLGAPIQQTHMSNGHYEVRVSAFAPPRFEIRIPGDASSAAFLLGAAVLTGSVELNGVGLNTTRIGFLETVARMGGNLRWNVDDEHMGEPVGTIAAERSELTSVGIEGPLVPLVLDELPLIAVLATQARGTTTVTGAEELRVKESDRIATIVDALRRLGADVQDATDGFSVEGPTTLVGAEVDAAGDHRIAMALAIAGLAAQGETVVHGFDAAAVSWPGFERVLASLGVDVGLR